MSRTFRAALAVALAVAPQLVAAQSASLRRLSPARPERAGPPIEVLDFEGLPAGTIVSELVASKGSAVSVTGFNPFLGAATNAALIFDSAHPTGGDTDLGTPHAWFGGPGIGAGGRPGPFQNDEARGKLLIVGENLNDWDGDGLVNSPDDLNAAASPSATLVFDFSSVGLVTILGLTVIDVEASEQPPIVTYFDAVGGVIGTTLLPATGNNGVAEVDLGGVVGVRRMRVQMRASGALDDLVLRRQEPASIAFVQDVVGVDVTPDGSTALLFDLGSSDGDTYFYETATGALELKTTVGSPLRDFPTAISSTLRVSAHHGDPVEAGLWTEAGGWLDLDNPFPLGCDDQGAAFDLSADGSVAVGLVWNECNAVAFRWTSGSGLVPLELLGASFPGSTNPPTNRATKISDDGAWIGGFAQTEIVDRWPALWRADGSGFLLPGGVFPDDAPGEVLSVSADGSTVAGIWNLEGFYWSEADGVVPLGLLPGALPGGQTFPNAIAADGELIFGKASPGFFDPPVVFVWTAAHGMRSLAEIAAASGVVLPPEITLDNVLAASSDGSVLVGTAFDFSHAYAFVLEFPVAPWGL